jgi:capsular exopolysaccharide synthesis family protein
VASTALEIHQPDVVDSPTVRTNATLMSVVWQRKSLVILGIVIGLVLGALFYAQSTPVYQSSAKVLVVKKSAQNALPGSSTGSAQMMMMEDYMSTQSVILQSQMIAEMTAKSDGIQRRLENEGFKSFPSVKKPDELVGEIMGNLTVTRDNKDVTGTMGNNVLVLNFRATDQAECQIILSALIDAYQRFIDETYKDISEALVASIDRARTEVEAKIEATEKKYEEFMQTISDTAAAKGGKMMSLLEQQCELTGQKVSIDKLELTGKKKELEVLKQTYEKQGPRATIQFILSTGRVPGMTGDKELDSAIQKLQMDEKELITQFGPKHPRVLQIQERQKMLKEIYSSGKGKEVGPDGKELDPAQLFIKGQEIAVMMLQERLNAYEAEHAKLKRQLADLRQVERQEEKLFDTRRRARELYNSIMRQVGDMEMRRDSGGFLAKAISPPRWGNKIKPQPFSVFTAAGLLGLLLGIGLAYLAEVSDKSFRNPNEIRKRLGLPVIGHVPFLAADEKAQSLVASGSSAIDPMLITHYQSTSIGAEAYRGVRTSLYFSTRGANHQVIQVTSPNVSDGKSTLAANLAVSIAQSGKRTLLIDADFRKPRVHKIFNVPATVGMASVMVGQADLNSAIQPTVIPNLSVLPCGPRPANPAELLTQPRFKELLDELRKQFDFVIVDTPPILVVTDPAVVAPRVDGVVLCIRVNKNGRPYAERAREVLASLGANVLGVVVNGFGSQVGGNRYGYEHYQYGYGEGYSYTYGYTYGYSDKEAASYYSANGDEPMPQLNAKS